MVKQKRRRSGPLARKFTRATLVVAAALVAMQIVPAGASAAPGDLAHGIVRVDANKDGAVTSAVIGEDDRGLAGVTVRALDAGGNVIATTTTSADGSWSITEQEAPGATRVEIVTDQANGNVYATHETSSGDDNAFVRSTAPNRATADITGSDAELNALVYPIWTFSTELAGAADGLGGKSVLTGTSPFEGPDTEPGMDSGPGNAIVRSADIVSYNWTITVADEIGSLGQTFEDAVFEQTIELRDGAVANFATIPAACDSVKSKITAYPGGAEIPAKVDPPAGTTSVTLSCVLGNLGGDPASARIINTQVQPSASSPNGSSFDTKSRSYAVDANGTATARPDAGPAVPEIKISAAPRFDIEKTAGTGSWGTQVVNGQSVHGYQQHYTIQIASTRKVGVEAFDQPLKIEESLWANRTVAGPNGEPAGSHVDGLDWYIIRCNSDVSNGAVSGSAAVGGKIGAGGNTEANSVRDSGTCTPTRDGNESDNYTLTFDGIDTTGLSYPTHTLSGAPVPANKFYVASYRILTFIPSTEIDKLVGEPSDGSGELRLSNRVGDFDPDSVSGASNFGSGTEPGYCAAGPGSDQSQRCDNMEDGSRSNNVTGPITVRMPSPGAWNKTLVDAQHGWGGQVGPLPDSSRLHDGNGFVQPGQTFTSRVSLTNQGVAPLAGAQYCDVFDNTMLKLAPLAQDRVTDHPQASPFDPSLFSAVLKVKDGKPESPEVSKAAQGNWVVKYGHADFTGDDPMTGEFDVPTNRWEGNWTQQRAAADGRTTACGDPGMTWFDSPSDLPGGIDAVNVVWLQAVPGYELEPQEAGYWYLGFEQRDRFNGGPHNGELIPSGTIAANYGNVRGETWNPNWSKSNYWPGAGETGPFTDGENGRKAGESTTIQGDRWSVTRANLGLQKRTIALEVGGESSTGVSDYGETGSARAGKPVVWEIKATVTAAGQDPAPVNNVVVTDTLPEYVRYDAAATSAIDGVTMPSSVTENADGTTTLVWELGTRTPNEEIPLLRIATYTDGFTPPNTMATNFAEVTADAIIPISTHKDDHTIRIEQDGQVQLQKLVDRTLDLQEDSQIFTLQLKNFSESLEIEIPTVYEALPYVGDGTNDANVNRTPASAFAGTNRMSEAPRAFEFDGTTALPGTFYYTTVPGAEVPQRQQEDTDPAIWSTQFTPDATGFKFVAAGPLTTTANASKSGIEIRFQTDQRENKAGDVYTNRFTVTSPTLDSGRQLLTSNSVSVRVMGFSLGDFVWFDLDGDGAYTEGTDRPAPEGVRIEVRNPQGTVVATTATLGGEHEGRWVVNNLPAGEYYITIPSSQFGAGQPLAGAVAATNPVMDPNTDLNEDADHHAIQAGGGVRSAGLITLDADTTADPIAGREPLGDNVAGLPLAPLTGDDFTNLTLDLALVPGAAFTVEKVVDGEAANFAAETEFEISVGCVYDGKPAPGFPKQLTLKGGDSAELVAPLGSRCEAEETNAGGASSVAIEPAALELDDIDGEFAITVTNTFAAGSFKILKEVVGSGASLAGGDYEFAIECTFNGSNEPVFQETVRLQGEGSSLESENIDGLPVGAACTITETESGGADETPDPVQIVIDNDPDTVQIAGFVNEFSAGTIEVQKKIDGAAAELPFVQDLEFDVAVTCQVERDGSRVDVFGDVVSLSGGESIVPSLNGEPVLLPVGARCFAEETNTQGAAKATTDHDSFENAAVVEKGNVDKPQVLTLTAHNTFELAELTVSKRVEGPAPADARFDFALECTYPVTSADGGVTQQKFPLHEGEAAFKLGDGEERKISVLAGSTCAVSEVDVPADVEVTVQDSEAGSIGGAEDGVLAELAGSDNTVQVLNTFPAAPEATSDLSRTGASPITAAVLMAAGLLLLGATLYVVRARKRGADRPDDGQ